MPRHRKFCRLLSYIFTLSVSVCIYENKNQHVSLQPSKILVYQFIGYKRLWYDYCIIQQGSHLNVIDAMTSVSEGGCFPLYIRSCNRVFVDLFNRLI